MAVKVHPQQGIVSCSYGHFDDLKEGVIDVSSSPCTDTDEDIVVSEQSSPESNGLEERVELLNRYDHLKKKSRKTLG